MRVDETEIQPLWTRGHQRRLTWVEGFLAALDNPEAVISCNGDDDPSPESKEELRRDLIRERIFLLGQFTSHRLGVARA